MADMTLKKELVLLNKYGLHVRPAGLFAKVASRFNADVEVAGLGVMLEGAPGLGKSETALGLIKRGNALVADDFTCLRKDVATNTLFASAADATRNYMEIRGIGIIHVPSIF